MVRRYDMQTRRRSAEATRQRIISACHDLLNRDDGGRLTLDEVARAAGVSRATIYNQLGSRRGLLAAVFEDQGRLIEFDRVLSAMKQTDPHRAVGETVRESCRAWSVMPDAIRRTLALAALDDEVGGLVEQYEGYRRVELYALLERLRAAGWANPTGSDDAALGVLAISTSFPAYNQLLLVSDHETASDSLVRMAQAALGLTLH